MGSSFAIVGAAGYVAPRHMAAIASVGGELRFALDPCDSVGVLDTYARGCLFTRDEREFAYWVAEDPVDYVVICSPNHEHVRQCVIAMCAGANVICEKPVALLAADIAKLYAVASETGRRVMPILQARYCDAVRRIPRTAVTSAQVRYNTPRGHWYSQSWKANPEMSGGLETNIGVHVLDLLAYLWGNVELVGGVQRTADSAKFAVRAGGVQVDVTLGVDPTQRAERVIIVGGETYHLEVGNGLHEHSYREILAGRGWRLADALSAVRVCEQIRSAS